MITTAIALGNNPLLLRHFTFDDDDDPDPRSVDGVPLEFEFGTGTRDRSKNQDNVNGVPRRVCFAFDVDDDPGPRSVDGVPLELELGAEVDNTFKGLEMDDNAAALSTLFENRKRKFSSPAKSYPGEG